MVRREEVKKPPYRVPSIEEVRAIPPNGYVVASTFSGCGGSSLGYRMAGFRVAYANEFVEAARETYRANFPDTFVDDRDIRKVAPEELLEKAGLRKGELDLLDGSPPCAAFSVSGKRESSWGKVKKYSDTKQRVDDLFFEYVRILRGTRPRAFVAENVAGLVVGTAKGYFREIFAALSESGYRVAARVLDAKWLGVPQSRCRLIFVGVREDLGVEPAYPGPLPYWYSIRDALRGVPPGEGKSFRTVPSLYREWKKLLPGESSKRYFNLIRSNELDVAPTVLASHGKTIASPTHFSEPRIWSIPELRRLCSFPDDFALTGDFTRQWERLGRAVPPLMMRAVAEVVRDRVLAAADRAAVEPGNERRKPRARTG